MSGAQPDDQAEQPATCSACGQALPGQPQPATDATPMPKIVVDLSDQIGARRIYWPAFDPHGDYTGTVTLTLSPVVAVKVPKVNVFSNKRWAGDYLDHDALFELARVTTDRPAPVAPVLSLARPPAARKPPAKRVTAARKAPAKRGQRAVPARKAPAKTDHPNQEGTTP